MTLLFRPTCAEDSAVLPAIERAASQRFLQIPDLAWLAASPVITPEQHRHYADEAMSWLVLSEDQPIGFVVAQAQGQSLFITEISLHIAWQGQGLGRRLLTYVAEQARNKGYTALILTTFKDVPWNAPWYARMGFEILPETTLSAVLRQKRQEETAHGFAYESRCAMRLMLD